MLAALVLCAGLNCLDASGQNNLPDTDPVRGLSQSRLFAFGGIGFAGVITKAEKDYRLVVARPSATADLEAIFASGTSEGKAYALVGIYHLNPARFKELAAPLRSSPLSVHTAHGCILSIESMGRVIRYIEGNGYR